jgi:fumiquinazoline A oxidase
MRLQLSYVPLLGLAAHVAAVDLEAMFGPYVSADTLIASSCDANYSSVVGPRWSTWAAPSYFGAIMPATEADLQKIVSSDAATLGFTLF